MSRIETEIWESVKEENGKVRYVGQRMAEDIFKEIKKTLKEEGLMPQEYFLMNPCLNRESTNFPRIDDVICYTRWGGSEGIYFDVDIVTRDEQNQRKIVNFVTGKTLEESIEAYDRMQYIAGYIYRLLMGDGAFHGRYMFLPKARKITEEDLKERVETEFTAYMKTVLYQQKDAEDKAHEELFGKLVIRAEIMESLPNCRFSEEEVELLYRKENILETMASFCEQMNLVGSSGVKEYLSSPELRRAMQETGEEA